MNKAHREAKACERWNASHPIGTAVAVRRDNGETMETTTRSEAGLVGNNAVIQVVGIAGCYLLSRVTAR